MLEYSRSTKVERAIARNQIVALGYYFNRLLLIKINDRNGDAYPCTYENVFSEDQVGKLITDMVDSPERFGLVISQGGNLDHDESKKSILLALALNLIPESIDCVVSVEPIWIETGHVETFKRLGVAVLMDFHDISPFEAVVPKDAFRSDIKNSSFWKLASDDVLEYMEYLADKTVLIDWFEKFTPYFSPLDEDVCEAWQGDRFSLMVDTLSFGSMKYTPRQKEWNFQLPLWRKSLIEEHFFCRRESSANGSDEASKQIMDLFSIWSARLEGTRALSKISPDMDDSKRRYIQDLGREMGIDKDLDALLAGVPVEDILAA